MTKIMHDGKVIGEVLTRGHSMLHHEILEYGLGLTTLTNQEELKEKYESGAGYVYTENDSYFLDIENIEVVE